MMDISTRVRPALARKYHRFAKRGRGDVGSGKANASPGAQAYLTQCPTTVGRAPAPRSMQPMSADLRPQPGVGDYFGLARKQSEPRPQPGIGEIFAPESRRHREVPERRSGE